MEGGIYEWVDGGMDASDNAAAGLLEQLAAPPQLLQADVDRQQAHSAPDRPVVPTGTTQPVCPSARELASTASDKQQPSISAAPNQAAASSAREMRIGIERRICQANSTRTAPQLPPPPRVLGLDVSEIAAADAALKRAIDSVKAAMEAAAKQRRVLRDFKSADVLRGALKRSSAARVSARIARAHGVDSQLVHEGSATLASIESLRRSHEHEVEEKEGLLHAALLSDSETALRSAMPVVRPFRPYMERALLEKASRRLRQISEEVVTKMNVVSALGAGVGSLKT